MNPLPYEVELYGLAVLLYLYDSSVLLYGNEAVLTRTSAQRWSSSWGWMGFSLARRTLCVLNPFTPHMPCFRLSWNFRNEHGLHADAQWPLFAERLQQIAPFVVISGIALFAILPLGLFSALGAYAVGAACVLLYGSVLLALYRLYGQRKSLALVGNRFWGFAFECIACPPFAVNMLRRITLAVRVTEPLPIASERLLNPEQWTKMRTECLSRVNLALQSADPGTAEYLALAAHKTWLCAYPDHR